MTGVDFEFQMYTDRYFSNTLHKAIHAHSQIAPTKTYAYIYDFVGKYNLGELFGVPRSEWSSAHTEDVMMIFNSSSYHHGLSKRDVEYQLSEIMTNVLSNFMATGYVPIIKLCYLLCCVFQIICRFSVSRYTGTKIIINQLHCGRTPSTYWTVRIRG